MIGRRGYQAYDTHILNPNKSRGQEVCVHLFSLQYQLPTTLTWSALHWTTWRSRRQDVKLKSEPITFALARHPVGGIHLWRHTPSETIYSDKSTHLLYLLAAMTDSSPLMSQLSSFRGEVLCKGFMQCYLQFYVHAGEAYNRSWQVLFGNNSHASQESGRRSTGSRTNQKTKRYSIPQRERHRKRQV